MGPSLGSGGRLEADIRTQRARLLRRTGRRRPARLAALPNARRRGNLRPRHGSPAPPELSNPGQPRPRPPPARSPGASALTPTLATARSQEGGARPPRPGLLRICRLSRVRCSEPAAFPAVRLSAPAYVLGGCSGLTSTPAQLAQVLPLRSLSLLRLGPCACSACSECVATALSPAVRRPVSWARRTPGAPRPPAAAARQRPSRASSRTPRAPAAPLPDRPPPLPASETEAAAGPRRQGSAGAGRPCQGATKSRGRTFWRGGKPARPAPPAAPNSAPELEIAARPGARALHKKRARARVRAHARGTRARRPSPGRGMGLPAPLLQDSVPPPRRGRVVVLDANRRGGCPCGSEARLPAARGAGPLVCLFFSATALRAQPGFGRLCPGPARAAKPRFTTAALLRPRAPTVWAVCRRPSLPASTRSAKPVLKPALAKAARPGFWRRYSRSIQKIDIFSPAGVSKLRP